MNQDSDTQYFWIEKENLRIAEQAAERMIHTCRTTIDKLQMLAAISGVMLTILLGAALPDMSEVDSVYILAAVFISVALMISVFGLFTPSRMEVAVNPNHKIYSDGSTIREIITYEIESNEEIFKVHYRKNERIWCFIHVSNFMLLLGVITVLYDLLTEVV